MMAADVLDVVILLGILLAIAATLAMVAWAFRYWG
jgi:hypothetical protein